MNPVALGKKNPHVLNTRSSDSGIKREEDSHKHDMQRKSPVRHFGGRRETWGGDVDQKYYLTPSAHGTGLKQRTFGEPQV